MQGTFEKFMSILSILSKSVFICVYLWLKT
jgi:hypothetical protein